MFRPVHNDNRWMIDLFKRQYAPVHTRHKIVLKIVPPPPQGNLISCEFYGIGSGCAANIIGYPQSVFIFGIGPYGTSLSFRGVLSAWHLIILCLWGRWYKQFIDFRKVGFAQERTGLNFCICIDKLVYCLRSNFYFYMCRRCGNQAFARLSTPDTDDQNTMPFLDSLSFEVESWNIYTPFLILSPFSFLPSHDRR